MTSLFRSCDSCGTDLGYMDHGNVCPDCARKPKVPTPKTADNDLSIGYRAGQADAISTPLLLEIIELDSIANESGDCDDFDALADKIEEARVAMKAVSL